MTDDEWSAEMIEWRREVESVARADERREIADSIDRVAQSDDLTPKERAAYEWCARLARGGTR